MNDLKLFILNGCPYCRSALRDIEALKVEHPELQNVKIHMIEERQEKALADSYDYYLVPSFFLNEVKVHEGAIKKERVYEILKSAI